jgi:hypothetical protein
MLPASTGPARGVLGVDGSWLNRPQHERNVISSQAALVIRSLREFGFAIVPLKPAKAKRRKK